LKNSATSATIDQGIYDPAQFGPIFHLARYRTLLDLGCKSSIENKGIGKFHRKRHDAMVALCYHGIKIT